MSSTLPKQQDDLGNILLADAVIYGAGFHQAQNEMTELANKGQLKFVVGRGLGRTCKYYVATYFTHVDLYFKACNLMVPKNEQFHFKFDQTLMHISDATDLDLVIPFNVYLSRGEAGLND